MFEKIGKSEEMAIEILYVFARYAWIVDDLNLIKEHSLMHLHDLHMKNA